MPRCAGDTRGSIATTGRPLRQGGSAWRDRIPALPGLEAIVTVVAGTDAELVARIGARDEDAFGAAYDRHVDVVYGSVLRFLRDRDATDEVVQDTFVALWRNVDQYTATAGTLAGWLLGIARNKAIDRLRAAARRPRLVDLGNPDEPDAEDRLDRAWQDGGIATHGADSDGDPEAATTRRWIAAVVRTALSAMPDAERRALELAYDEGLTQAEIAVRLGWPLGTVKTRTRRALTNLRSVLEGIPEFVGDEGRSMARSSARTLTQDGTGGSDGAR